MDYLEIRISLEPKEHWADLLAAELAGIGFDSFLETPKGLFAYVKEEQFNKELFDSRMSQFDHSFQYSVHITKIKGRNWNEEWEKNFEPITVRDNLLVRAPFHPMGGNKYAYEIVLEPKMSFGTGHHETTWLMLDELFKMDVKGKHILDMGCGTGILAILASKLGAAQVVAIDCEENAVENTKENAASNGVFGIIVEKGGEDSLAGRSFHVILANINRNVLISHMKHYSQSLVKNGDLLLSGFFETDADLLQTEAMDKSLRLLNKSTRNGWCMMHFQKNI